MMHYDRAGCGSRRVTAPRVLRSRLTRLATIGATLVVASAALAAQASAATITAHKACYVNADPAVGAPMVITGSGFVPGDTVDLSGDTVFTTAPADPNGNVVFSTAGPILPTIYPATQHTTLVATDEDNPITASTVVQSANLSISTRPSEVKNLHKDKVRFSFSGFTPGKQIYGFYARRRVVAKTKFGRAKGACGTLTKRVLLYPGGHPRHDSYTVSFESRSKYSKTAYPRVVAKLSTFAL